MSPWCAADASPAFPVFLGLWFFSTAFFFFITSCISNSLFLRCSKCFAWVCSMAQIASGSWNAAASISATLMQLRSAPGVAGQVSVVFRLGKCKLLSCSDEAL